MKPCTSEAPLQIRANTAVASVSDLSLNEFESRASNTTQPRSTGSAPAPLCEHSIPLGARLARRCSPAAGKQRWAPRQRGESRRLFTSALVLYGSKAPTSLSPRADECTVSALPMHPERVALSGDTLAAIAVRHLLILKPRGLCIAIY